MLHIAREGAMPSRWLPPVHSDAVLECIPARNHPAQHVTVSAASIDRYKNRNRMAEVCEPQFHVSWQGHLEDP